jgi:hypothetical protein
VRWSWRGFGCCCGCDGVSGGGFVGVGLAGWVWLVHSTRSVAFGL